MHWIFFHFFIVKKLTAELEEERTTLEKMTKGIAAGPGVTELLEYMKQTPVFYHKVMLFFRRQSSQKRVMRILTSKQTTVDRCSHQTKGAFPI